MGIHRRDMEVKVNYCDIRRLGSGGYNKVSIVQYIQTGDFYVAKSSKIQFKNSTTFSKNEASLLKKIDSPLIPKLKECFETEEGSTLIIELCHGNDLLKAIAKQIINLSENIIRII